MDCQNIVFSTQQSNNRINKALKVIPLQILKRILSFALYILGAKMKYKFMKKYASEHCIRTMARVLGVSRSAYYRWLETPISQRKSQDIQLIAKIKKYQEEFKFSYGGERLTRHIKKEEGIKLGHNRVSRLMKEHGLGAKRKIKWRKPKESKDFKSTIPNLLARKFDVSEPNTVWVSDISYIKTNREWVPMCYN